AIVTVGLKGRRQIVSAHARGGGRSLFTVFPPKALRDQCGRNPHGETSRAVRPSRFFSDINHRLTGVRIPTPFVATPICGRYDDQIAVAQDACLDDTGVLAVFPCPAESWSACTPFTNCFRAALDRIGEVGLRRARSI